MNNTNWFGLDAFECFKKVRKGLKETNGAPKNILACHEGILFVWDQQDQCALTSNLAALGNDSNAHKYQTLLPTVPPLFAANILRVNANSMLMVVGGVTGVMVMELPAKSPPHGSFADNKEMIYCRSHMLDERLLAFTPGLRVNQVRFHPAAATSNIIFVLTSDNALRVYRIDNAQALSMGVFDIGRRPEGILPGSKSYFLELLGETGVDFDFAPPILVAKDRDVAALHDLRADKEMASRVNEIQWPIVVLDGDGLVAITHVALSDAKARMDVPTLVHLRTERKFNEASSILCLATTPPIICIATATGDVFHGVLLSQERHAKEHARKRHAAPPPSSGARARHSLYLFENVQLELGLCTASATDNIGGCAIVLHADESRLGNYFAVHEAGVHFVSIGAADALHKFLHSNGSTDCVNTILQVPSKADYLLCTKMASSGETNPVIGFAIHYEPVSIIALLGSGQVVNILAISAPVLPSTDDLGSDDDVQGIDSPLKQMLSEPFDLHIRKILKQITAQPILKMPPGVEHTPQECYELLQRAGQAFREDHLVHLQKAREEIEKRVRVLQMLKKYQSNELSRMNSEVQQLVEARDRLSAHHLAATEQQQRLKKRCEHLLMLVSQKRTAPSEAELKFEEKLEKTRAKLVQHTNNIDNLKKQVNYQETKMKDYKQSMSSKYQGLGSIQSEALKTNLQNSTDTITQMIKEINEYKKQLGLN